MQSLNRQICLIRLTILYAIHGDGGIVPPPPLILVLGAFHSYLRGFGTMHRVSQKKSGECFLSKGKN